ncbi:MAG: DUF2203 family protein [Thermoanaerobaculia bacterium]
MRLKTPRIFSYDEALSVFPVVRDLTAEAVMEVAALIRELDADDLETIRRSELEASHQQVVEQWAREIEALGLSVKGPWLVDWDCGDGYYCWRHPEPGLAHFHGYDEGFSARVPIN